MGKKLIIKGADFSAVAVDSLLTLDSIAWDNKTYREIFETNNFLGISPGFENGSYSPLVVNSGEPTITNEVADSGQYSLKAFGNTSQQIKKSVGAAANTYYIAYRISCTRYVSGIAGVIYGTGASSPKVESITQGFISMSGIVNYTGTTNYLFFVGSASSADLDCYIDTPVVVLGSYFSTLPTEEQFAQLYEQYVAIKKGA